MVTASLTCERIERELLPLRMPVKSRAVASFENKLGRGRPLDWPERVHMNPFGTSRASAKLKCEHTRSKTKIKSLIVHIVGLAKRRTLSNLSVVILGVISPLAFADVGTWSLDSTISSARLFQGSAANPDSVNTGVARVTGKVKLNPNDLQNSAFDLSIYPADEQWGHALSPEGTLPADYVPDATEHTLLTFKSKQILRTGNGKLKVIGELTLTRVDRSVTATPSEAYAGPLYGKPIIHITTREVRSYSRI